MCLGMSVWGDEVAVVVSSSRLEMIDRWHTVDEHRLRTPLRIQKRWFRNPVVLWKIRSLTQLFLSGNSKFDHFVCIFNSLTRRPKTRVQQSMRIHLRTT